MKIPIGLRLVCALFSLTGCSTKSYVATSNYAPNLRRVGDYEISAGAKIRLTPLLPAPEINVAFSPLPHIGILGSYRQDFKSRYPDYKDYEVPTEPYLRQTLGEIGIGYYYIHKARYGFALYGGYTSGSLQRRDDVLPPSSKRWASDLNIRFHRYWLMAYTTLLRGEVQHVEGGFGVKVSRQIFDEYRAVDGFPVLDAGVGQGFNSLEPFLFGRIGKEAHQLHLQAGIAYPQTKTFAEPFYPHLSIQYVFVRPFKKKKNKALGESVGHF